MWYLLVDLIHYSSLCPESSDSSESAELLTILPIDIARDLPLSSEAVDRTPRPLMCPDILPADDRMECIPINPVANHLLVAHVFDQLTPDPARPVIDCELLFAEKDPGRNPCVKRGKDNHLVSREKDRKIRLHRGV